jgi:hypothetical protein
MMRALIIAACLIASHANAGTDSAHWSGYAEEDSVVTMPPLGVVVDERWPDIDFRDVVALRMSPTDDACEAFDARHGNGAAARVLSN